MKGALKTTYHQKTQHTTRKKTTANMSLQGGGRQGDGGGKKEGREKAMGQRQGEPLRGLLQIEKRTRKPRGGPTQYVKKPQDINQRLKRRKKKKKKGHARQKRTLSFFTSLSWGRRKVEKELIVQKRKNKSKFLQGSRNGPKKNQVRTKGGLSRGRPGLRFTPGTKMGNHRVTLRNNQSPPLTPKKNTGKVKRED